MEGAPSDLGVIKFHHFFKFSSFEPKLPKHSADQPTIFLFKAEFEEAWPTIQKLYEEIHSSAMEGTGMTKLFQTLLDSVPPELVEVLPPRY